MCIKINFQLLFTMEMHKKSEESDVTTPFNVFISCDSLKSH